MKKFSLVLVFLIVLAQLAWLCVQFDTLSFHLDNAPRMRVRATLRGLTICAISSVDKLRGDDALFGKSLWWDATEWTNIISTQEGALTSRDKQCDDAQKLSPTSPKKLAGFWHADSEGLWRLCRIEAVGSSEDTCRPGELRTPLSRLTTPTFTHKNGIVFIVADDDKADNLYAYSGYELNFDEVMHFEDWRRKHEDIPVVIELALRDNLPPIVTQFLIGGKPYHEVKDSFESSKNPS